MCVYTGALGIGRALTLSFAQTGNYLAVCLDINKNAGMALQEIHPNIKFIHVDVQSPTQCQDAVQRAKEWSKKEQVDVLINNVGVQIDNGLPVHKLPVEIWDKVMNINVRSYFLMSKYVLPDMLEFESGVILNIASVQGHQSQVGIPAYASSKGAILSLTRNMVTLSNIHNLQLCI